jgi:hypothetical protein
MIIVIDKIESKKEFIHNNLDILNFRFDPLVKKMWIFSLNFF